MRQRSRNDTLTLLKESGVQLVDIGTDTKVISSDLQNKGLHRTNRTLASVGKMASAGIDSLESTAKRISSYAKQVKEAANPPEVYALRMFLATVSTKTIIRVIRESDKNSETSKSIKLYASIDNIFKYKIQLAKELISKFDETIKSIESNTELPIQDKIEKMIDLQEELEDSIYNLDL